LANARHKSEVRRAAVSTRYQRTNEATNEPTNVGSASSTNVEAISGAKTNPIIIKGGGDITAPVESTKEIGKRRYNVPHKHKQRRKRQNLYHHLSQASVSMPTYTKPPQNHIKALPEPHRNITTTTLRPPSTLQRFRWVHRPSFSHKMRWGTSMRRGLRDFYAGGMTAGR
jgi:hypothetical protein